MNRRAEIRQLERSVPFPKRPRQMRYHELADQMYYRTLPLLRRLLPCESEFVGKDRCDGVALVVCTSCQVYREWHRDLSRIISAANDYDWVRA